LLSLDAFRGLALVGMILVNVPGADVWPQLRHAAWDGLTAADVVFPAFLFAMGASLAFGTPPTAIRVVRRVAVLAGAGLLVNYAATGDPWRYPGVLQRIAFDYLLASAVIRLPRRAVAVVVLALLGGYTLALHRYGATPTRSLESTVDVAVFGRSHLLFGAAHDPEGLVSSVASLATVLVGFLVGSWMREAPRTWGTAARLGAVAVVLGLLAWPTTALTALNKRLWTPSYTLTTAAICAVALALMLLVCDVGRRRLRGAGVPLAVIGANSLVVYVGSELAAIGLQKVVTPVGPCTPEACLTTTGYGWLFDRWFEPWAGPRMGSLAFSLAFVGVFWVLAALLWRARIFVRA
jgi:predicted acyltransferase